MTHMTIARSYLGTKEIKGSANNPKIMEMYRSVGHHWVEHDEVVSDISASETDWMT